MFMKKNVLVSLSVATLLSVGAVGVNEVNSVANNTSIVQAAVKNSATAEKKTNNSKNSTANDNKHNSSNSQSKKQEWIKEKGYIYFTDDQVSQIQNYLWQKINAYRQSKGYPAYKTNPELNNFVNRVMQKGTPEYNAVGYGIGTIQNTDTLGHFLPKLKALGMDSARSLNDLDAFRYNNVKQHFINLKERDPKKV